MSATPATTRRWVLGGLLAALVALVLAGAWVRDDRDATITARFVNAGQLVEGGLVQVAGRRIGVVRELRIADDGTAEAVLAVDPDELEELGTPRAAIRTVGQAGVASRFVELTPGPRGSRPLRDGDVLPADRTSGVVDLDALFNTLDAPARRDVRELVRRSASLYAGSGADDFNAMLRELDPTLAETDELLASLSERREDLRRLVTASRRTATAVAGRRRDLREAVGGLATAMHAVAGERAALDEVLRGTPTVLRRSRTTLGHVARSARTLRPVLREVPPTARALAPVVDRMPPVLRAVDPPARRLAREAPALTRTLRALPGTTRATVPALRATRATTARAQPVLRGVRYYGSDFVLGVLNGLAGIAVGNYNDLGHYARLEFVQNVQTALGGGLASLVPQLTSGSLAGVLGVRLRRTARCPGSAAPPAPDGSAPWVPEAGLCDPSHGMPESVNHP